MPRAALTLLGGFAARDAGDIPVRFPRRKAAALLTYLACGGAQPHPRDKLSALLWPEASASQARHSLRQTLASLRQGLPPGVLRVDDATVALDLEAVDVDVLTFRRLVAEGTPAAHAQAAALYVGDLLAGINVKDAAPFEEWLLSEREALHELALTSLARLLAWQREANDTAGALHTALRLLALDPLQEVVHRAVMRLQTALSRRDAALRQYQTCVAVLHGIVYHLAMSLTSLVRPRQRPARGWIAGGVASLLLLGPGVASSATFRVDPERTRLAVRLYREGIGGRLAHDHVVEATEVTGQVEYDAARPDASAIVIEVRTASLRVDEPAARRRLGVEGDLSESQRADVGKAMRSPEQLDVARYPAIRFASTRIVADGEGRLRVTGALTLRGVTREVSVPATVALDGGTLRARATLSFLQSSFGYRPYSAALGAIRNKDEVTLHVDLVAAP